MRRESVNPSGAWKGLFSTWFGQLSVICLGSAIVAGDPQPIVLETFGNLQCVTIWIISRRVERYEAAYQFHLATNNYSDTLSYHMFKCDIQFKNESICKLGWTKEVFKVFTICEKITQQSIDTFGIERNASLRSIVEGTRVKNTNWNVVLFEFYGVPQPTLNMVFTYWSRMRDFHHQPLMYAPIFIVSKLITDAANATLLSRASAQAQGMLLASYPCILPAVQVYESSGVNVYSLWRKYRFSTNGDVLFTRVPSLELNFAYCDIPKIRTESIWDFMVLIEAFDVYTWLTLVLTMIMLNVVIGQHVLRFQNIEAFTQRIAVVMSIWPSVLSALVSFGPSVVAIPGMRKSPLFLLWMLVCNVIVNYYSGSITSLLISPPKEDTMVDIFDVVRRNYSLIFDDPVHLNILASTVDNFLRNFRIDDKDIEDEDGRADMKALETLLVKTNKAGKEYVFTNKTVFAEKLAFGKNKAMVYQWPFVFSMVSHANTEIDARKKKTPKSKRRHCYVGGKLIPSAEVFMVFTPPGSQQLRDIGQTVFESGLYIYWMTEFVKMAASRRVQDRAKVVSPTNIKYDFVNTISAIQMEGKVSTIFRWWILCVIVCCGGFFLEKIIAYLEDLKQAKRSKSHTHIAWTIKSHSFYD